MKHSVTEGKPAKRLAARVRKFDSLREDSYRKPGSLKK